MTITSINNRLFKLMSILWRIIAPLKLAHLCTIITMLFGATAPTSFASNSFKLKNLTHINQLFQDQEGLIWLGGQHGLTRFDGEKSIRFSSDNPKQLLPFNWIHDFVQDDDLLLLATETHGLWSMNTKTGQTLPIVSDIDNSSFYDIAMFRGNYYFQTESSLYKYQIATGKVDLIVNDIAIIDIVNTSNELYISTNSGLFRLQESKLVKVVDQPVSTVITIKDTVIAVTNNNIYSISDIGKHSMLALEESVSQITSSYNQSSFYTINNNGDIKKYSTSDLRSQHHGYVNSRQNRIRSMLHDSSGVLWLASNQGVDRLFENTVIDHARVFDIKTNANDIALLNDEIIIGSYGVGLQNFISEEFDSNTNNNFTSNGLKVTNLVVVEQELYIATFDGLWHLNKEHNQVNKVKFSNNNKLILKLRQKGDSLYIATNSNGLYAYDFKKNNIKWHIKQENGLSSPEVIDVLSLDNGNIWLATAKGLDIYDPITKKVENIRIPGGNKLVAVTLAENKVFAASLGDGIFVLNLQGELLAHIGQGISFSGFLLTEGEIWASARPGLYRLNPKKHQLSMLENTGEYSFVGSSLVHDNILYSSHYGGILELDLTKQPIFNPKVLISKTTISGESYLLNNTIKVASSNDLITLDLASLDYRPGLAKRYQYKLNNNDWQPISGAQLTLTGLASGDYNIEIMATNSLGQWSENRAYTEIHVAYPWYWTFEMRVLYALISFFAILFTAWLLYLRTMSINHIHNLLKTDMRSNGKRMQLIQRNLLLANTSLSNNEPEKCKLLIENSLKEIEESTHDQEPDNLSGKQLNLAIPFLASYLHSKYQVKLQYQLGTGKDDLKYELQADIYKIIFEALMSSILKSEAKNFNLTIKEVKQKLWLTISVDSQSFYQFDSKVNFDLASYTIRQLVIKHNASLNCFDIEDGSSQLVISFPLMALN